MPWSRQSLESSKSCICFPGAKCSSGYSRWSNEEVSREKRDRKGKQLQTRHKSYFRVRVKFLLTFGHVREQSFLMVLSLLFTPLLFNDLAAWWSWLSHAHADRPKHTRTTYNHTFFPFPFLFLMFYKRRGDALFTHKETHMRFFGHSEPGSSFFDLICWQHFLLLSSSSSSSCSPSSFSSFPSSSSSSSSSSKWRTRPPAPPAVHPKGKGNPTGPGHPCWAHAKP